MSDFACGNEQINQKLCYRVSIYFSKGIILAYQALAAKWWQGSPAVPSGDDDSAMLVGESRRINKITIVIS